MARGRKYEVEGYYPVKRGPRFFNPYRAVYRERTSKGDRFYGTEEIDVSLSRKGDDWFTGQPYFTSDRGNVTREIPSRSYEYHKSSGVVGYGAGALSKAANSVMWQDPSGYSVAGAAVAGVLNYAVGGEASKFDPDRVTGEETVTVDGVGDVRVERPSSKFDLNRVPAKKEDRSGRAVVSVPGNEPATVLGYSIGGLDGGDAYIVRKPSGKMVWQVGSLQYPLLYSRNKLIPFSSANTRYNSVVPDLAV